MRSERGMAAGDDLIAAVGEPTVMSQLPIIIF